MIKVFYSQNQSTDKNSSYSPSAGKPKKVISQWKRLFKSSIKVVEPKPLSLEDISLAHEPEFVKNVLEGKARNGFGNCSKEIADTLPWTTGSFYSAALEALKTNSITVSPTSGFHHAFYASNGGFCTFNGLMITAMKLHEEKLATRIGILDLDQHYGDGTDDIINELGIDFISHYTSGQHHFSIKDAEDFLQSLNQLLDEKFSNSEILLYQAGADCHINDPLGGWMNSEHIYQRDLIIFNWALKNKIPLVWNLAGGYQSDPETGSIQKVLDIHNNTMKACISSQIVNEKLS